MKDLAWVTCREFISLTPNERLVVDRLRDDGVIADMVAWDDASIDWDQYRLVIVRSIWDYHLKVGQFKAWLSDLKRASCRVLNPVDVMLWNHHKFYLRELERSGVNIIPSQFHDRGPLNLKSLMDTNDWTRVVLKPAVSASAQGIMKVSVNDVNDQGDAISSLAREHDLIIQRYTPEIESEGEWSLMFFNNEFSHSVLKLPKQGDFRVQSELGGTSRLITPEPQVVQQVTNLVRNLDMELLYCRVDGIIVNHRFLLMEIELIEPELFLFTEEIRTKFADAIRLQLDRKS